MMKSQIKLVLTFVLPFLFLFGCETSITNQKPGTNSDLIHLEQANVASAEDAVKATGEFKAKWMGCSEEGENPDDQHGDNNEEEGEGQGCQSNRPALDIYVRFDAQNKNTIKGNVTFMGLGEYAGIEFQGTVTWIKAGPEVGHDSNEVFFGGKITNSSADINRGCFLFAVQDNGEGANANPDSLQYRLYGSTESECKMPDHLPKGHPFAVYSGNIQVH